MSPATPLFLYSPLGARECNSILRFDTRAGLPGDSVPGALVLSHAPRACTSCSVFRYSSIPDPIVDGMPFLRCFTMACFALPLFAPDASSLSQKLICLCEFRVNASYAFTRLLSTSILCDYLSILARRFALVHPEQTPNTNGELDCSLAIAEANEDDSGVFEVLVAFHTRDGVFSTLSPPFQVNVTCTSPRSVSCGFL